MSEKLKNTFIGIFLLIAIALILWMILFLKPTVGDGKKTYKVRFSNILGINKGTRVTFAGRPVGIVYQITEVPNAREQHTNDSDGTIYFYQLTLKVDSSVKIYTTDEIALQTSGLLGEKSIAIIPQTPPKGITPILVTDQIVYANSKDPIENALNQVSNLSKKIDSAVSDFNEWFLENEDGITLAINNFSSAMGEIDIAVNCLNKEQIIPKTSDVMDLLDDNLNLIYTSLNQLQENNTFQTISQTVDEIHEAAKSFNTDGKQILSNMNQITYDIAQGKGTLGKIITSDALYLQFRSLMSKSETLLNDVNHYGVLFQYDKSWQRQRVKRANLLEALKTPKEFRSYFETEIDGINTSINRIGSLMQKASCEKNKILTCKPFQKDFAELLRKVNDLSSTIETYNEELNDQILESNNRCE